MPSNLLVDTTGPVARVTLNRPEVRNAFNDGVIAELSETFTTLGQREDLRCIVLAAEGKAFCAGADLNWMKAMAGYSWDENRLDAGRLAQMLWTIYRSPVPVIARVQGDVYAGGVGLVACADIVVSTANAGYCLSEAKLGPAARHHRPVCRQSDGRTPGPALLHHRRAVRRRHGEAAGPGARGGGRTPSQLDAKVSEIAALLCANGPAAVRACKRLALDLGDQPLTEELRTDTARRIADIRASSEGKAGVQSFLWKTPPPWL